MRETLANAFQPAFGPAVVGHRRGALEERAAPVDGEAITPDEHVAVHRAGGRTGAADFPLQVEADRQALSHVVGEVVDANPERLETKGPVLTRRLAHQLGPDTVAAQFETLPRWRDLVVAHGNDAFVTGQPDHIRPKARVRLALADFEAHETVHAVGARELEQPC